MNQPFLRTLQHISSFRTTTPSPPSPHLLLIPLLSLYSFFSFIVPSIGFSKHETFSPPLLERGTPISLPALLLCVHPSQTKHYLTVVWVHKDKDGREREAERAIRLLKDREASTNGGIKKDRSVLQHRRSWEKRGGTRSTLYLCNIARSLSLSLPSSRSSCWDSEVAQSGFCPARTANNEDRLEWRHTTSSFRPCHRHREMKKWG